MLGTGANSQVGVNSGSLSPGGFGNPSSPSRHFGKQNSFHDMDDLQFLQQSNQPFGVLGSPQNIGQPAQKISLNFMRQNSLPFGEDPKTPLQNLVNPDEAGAGLRSSPALQQYLMGKPHLESQAPQPNPSLTQAMQTHMQPLPDMNQVQIGGQFQPQADPFQQQQMNQFSQFGAQNLQQPNLQPTATQSNTLGIPGGSFLNPNQFHGKSMRSIQLFNNPTAASPPALHPSVNPNVEISSPRMKPGRSNSIPMPPNPLLNIHADSCYNFLNKRRYKTPGAQMTPLEAFFLKECLAQYKVAENLQRTRAAPLAPPAPLPQIRRTKKYLLILDIDETLVHSEVLVDNGREVPHSGKPYDHQLTFNNPGGKTDVFGVRIRPFAQEFIGRMARIYDLAVYTASSRDYADAVMDLFDPQRSIFCARLYRENCIRQGNMNIKDMGVFDENSFLVDNLIYSYAFHMNNGIPICPFVDDTMDVELQDLADILEHLPQYESFNAMLQDLLGLQEFYQSLAQTAAGVPARPL
jgi:Dullard-like phosphatase family protein